MTPHCLLMFGTRRGFLLPLTRHFLPMQHTQSRNKPKPHKAKSTAQTSLSDAGSDRKQVRSSLLFFLFLFLYAFNQYPLTSLFPETHFTHQYLATPKPSSTTTDSKPRNPQSQPQPPPPTALNTTTSSTKKPTNIENPNPNPRILRSKTKITKMRCGFLFLGINLCMYENGGVGLKKKERN